jgi:NAD(P)-dependent dehydrogenase (short-subunit alcohol dehydrogenase family)
MSDLFDFSLGGALAEGLAAAGATVAIVGRNAERGSARVDAIRGAGNQAAFFAADAMDRASLTEARRAIEKTLGAVTVLVNAAGGNDPKVTVTAENSFAAITVENWRANFDLNLVAHLPLSRVVTYSAAKAAVLNLTQFLSREWAPQGVRVNSITPGFFPAEQNRRLLFQDDGSPTPRAQSILNHTPMARFGQAQELIGAAVFLASTKASGFVTGIDLRVDGGFLSQTI